MFNHPIRLLGGDALSYSFTKTSAASVVDPVTVGQSSSSFRWDAIEPRQNIGSSGYFGNASYLDEHSRVEFDIYDAGSVDLQILAFTAIIDVVVDDKYTSSASLTNDASGSPMILTLTWRTKKKRNVKIYGLNFGFAGAFIPKTARIAAPSYVRKPLTFVLGDSYTQATGAQSTTRAWCNTLGALMGWDVIQCGIGSTGWTSSGTTLPATRVSSSLAARTNTPDRIRCALGFNDAGGDMVLLQSQMATAIELMKTDFPSAVIEVQGPWTPLGETTALATVKKKLIQICAAESIAFGDISGIITAGNSATYGLGDNVHPNDLGHFYLGQQIALVPFSAPTLSTTWNASDKTATLDLSVGATVATANANTADPQVRSVASHSSGKLHVEFEVNLAGGTFSGAIGFALSTHSFSTYLGGDAPSVGVWLSTTDTLVIVNNIVLYHGGPSIISKGNVYALDIDLTGKLLWYTDITNGGSPNNNASANVATGTLGVDISSMTAGAIFACCEIDTTGDAIRLIAMPTGIEGALPSGYSVF